MTNNIQKFVFRSHNDNVKVLSFVLFEGNTSTQVMFVDDKKTGIRYIEVLRATDNGEVLGLRDTTRTTQLYVLNDEGLFKSHSVAIDSQENLHSSFIMIGYVYMPHQDPNELLKKNNERLQYFNQQRDEWEPVEDAELKLTVDQFERLFEGNSNNYMSETGKVPRSLDMESQLMMLPESIANFVKNKLIVN